MKSYNRKEVFNKTKEYFNGDELATNVWINKYALKDSNGNIFELTPEDMHKRLSKEISRIEQKYENPMPEEKIFELLKDFKYIVPAGSPMAGIGNQQQMTSLSNCFVVGNESDSYGGIFRTDENQAQLMKRRGGVGHDLSHIRPRGFPVKNSALSSTGVVPFMERYSNTTREVAQDGRRGALMLTIDITHPDAEEFIDVKMEQGKITGANISVKITNEFMKAVLNNEEFIQKFPIDSDNPSFTKKINANKLWKKIIHNSWSSAEPGILFWDNVINESVPDMYGEEWKTISTNPCGEIPLCKDDACRLLSLNLYSYVEKPFTEEAYFNFELFKEHVKYAQRIMDDIIDLEIEKIDQIIEKVENDPEPEKIKFVEKKLWQDIRDKNRRGRRTGVGVTAEGDMLAALNLTYGTKQSTDFAEKVHKILSTYGYISSIDMAKERGSFPDFDFETEKGNLFVERMKNELKNENSEYIDLMKKYGRRNISLFTIAPNGSLSIMTQTTSGIEPVFMPAYERNRKVNPNDKDVNISYIDESGDAWETYTVFHPKFLEWLKIKGYDVDKVRKMKQDELNKLIEKSPYYNASSNDIDWVEKVRMQGKIQAYVDHSISNTINLPENVSEETVYKVYEEGWKNSCKGITIYREGSRNGVLVSNKDKKQDKKEETKQVNRLIKESSVGKRPKWLDCDVIMFKNKGEEWIGFIGLSEEGDPYEIFTGVKESFPVPNFVSKGFIKKEYLDEKKNDGKSKKRYDFVYYDKDGYEQEIKGLSRAFRQEYWDTAKLISAVLRHGMPIVSVINLLDSLKLDGEIIGTWKSGVKRMLKKYLKEDIKDESSGMTICPECSEKTLVNQGGCVQCFNCGYSKCE